MAERIVEPENAAEIRTLFGSYDDNIKSVENNFNVHIVLRNDIIKILGDEPNITYAAESVESLIKMIREGNDINNQTVRYVNELAENHQTESLAEIATPAATVGITTSGHAVRPRTVGQKRYIEAIQKNTVVFGIGPAGTGKTYLAVAMAARALRSHKVSKIILTRPAVEAGEKLGFLPGDLQEKVDPYLRPLYDALWDMLGVEATTRLIEQGVIEIAPLAYMRGRTLEDAFIILDEAQNTTGEQMKMFLTRLGTRSRMVITGDLSQIDLPSKVKSGLAEAVSILDGIEDISIQRFSASDVVRHKLVSDIIKAYDNETKMIESKQANNQLSNI